MSQDKVAFVRGLLEGAAGLDKQALLDILPEAVAQAFTEDARWEEDPSRADQQIWRGHEGICASWRRWLDQVGRLQLGDQRGRGSWRSGLRRQP